MNRIYFLFIAVFWLCLPDTAYSQVIINEALSSNLSGIADEDGSREDWIELYNPTTDAIALSGFGLSDNPLQPFKWVFPDSTLQAGGYMLIWCSDKNRTDADFPLHTNFKISSDGETLVLTQPSGTVSDILTLPALPQNISYGKQPDAATGLFYFDSPTPNASNATATAFDSILPAPVFSASAGFYDDPFDLTITTVPGATIIYSYDSSEPSPANLGIGTVYSYKNSYEEHPGVPGGDIAQRTFASHTYAAPVPIIDRSDDPNTLSSLSSTYNYFPYYIPLLPIQKACVVRARAYKDGALPSPVVTAIYFIGTTNFNFSLPVVSLNLTENLLFDYSNGIYNAGIDFDQWRAANPLAIPDGLTPANYRRSGDAWEVRANFSYFSGQAQLLNQDVGIRTHGGWSRSAPNKSLRLYAREEFGESEFGYSFFPGNPTDVFGTLILRNAGNDNYGTRFRDAFIQRSVKHLNFITQSYQPVILFLNSEYWGVMDLRERFDDDYFENVFGIDESEIEHLENNSAVISGDATHYNAMLDYIATHPMENDADFAYVSTLMDMENFTDYYIANIYAANTDWPHNNIEFWRKKTDFQPGAEYGHDGRWRWAMRDTDYGFGGNNLLESYTENTLAYATTLLGTGDVEWPNFLLRHLLENQSFRYRFISRFADLINTAFKPERLLPIIAEMKAQLEPEMPRHIARWNTIGSIANWTANIAVMETFALLRPDFQRQHIKENFGLHGTISVLLDADDSQGYIKINTIDIRPSTPGVTENPYPWTGIYFPAVPVTLKAVALPGYEFSHWSGISDSNDAEITLIPNGDFSITAHFTPVENSGIVPIYFWMIDASVANDLPLTSVDASFESAGQAYLEFRSALEGYPFTPEHINWRKASMERRNSPTEINYLPEANDGEVFADSEMRGLQIKQPFQDNDRENTMIFHLPTDGYKDIKVAFAAKNENAADALLLDYSVTADEQWTTAGLPVTVLPLSDSYQLYQADFSAIAGVNHNPDFKVRLRFAGTNMTADNGDRVTFNNVSVTGIAESLGITQDAISHFYVYPNPASETLYVNTIDNQPFDYRISTIDGRIVGSGTTTSEIALTSLSSGIYLLELTLGNFRVKKKFSKQ